MQPIGAILYAYFVCDAISRRRPMTPAEAQAARATWDAVRAVHLRGEERDDLAAGSERRARALRIGQRRHADWVRENAETVAALRRLAEPRPGHPAE
jgi:hypothetical protein